MSYQGKLKRYLLVIQKINYRQGCTFKELYEYLNDEGFEISQRTLQRDIEQIRNEFGIEVKYNSTDKGYYIDRGSENDTDVFLQLLSINDTAEILISSMKEGNSFKRFLQFENHRSFAGTAFIKPLLLAAKKSKRVLLTHKSFVSEQEKEYTIEPYLLKEYQRRWYVWGKIEGKKEFRTFGLDRIISVLNTNRNFDRDKTIDPEKVFADNIGLVYSTDAPKEIILTFTSVMGKYVKMLPIHSSQQILSESVNECKIRIFVNINHELKNIILSYGPAVVVESPKVLANELKALYRKAFKSYN